MSKRLISVALSAVTLVGLVGVTPVNAQSTADLQSQIQALLGQIQTLQGKLATGGSSSSSAYSFTKDLTLGSKGADVTALQQVLINGGYLKISAPTGYFGPLTKAAVKAWQAAVGLPSTGYFGPKSRAYANSMTTGGTTGGGTTGGTTGGGTTGGGTTGGSTTTPVSGLQVSLGSGNPTVGSLIAGAGRVPVLDFKLTAGASGAVTVNSIVFRKAGVISDSNISGAYLVQSGKVVAQYVSLSNGAITFSNLGWTVPAGQTQEYWLAVDVSTGVTAGNTVGFSLNSANDINSVDASNNVITETGNFPIQGTIFTASTVNNPSLATLTIASSSVGTTVYAGSQNLLVSAWNATVANNPVKLTSVKFRVIGSAAKSDLQNVKLYVNGVQVGSTLSAVAANGDAYFDLSASPAVLRTGSSNIQVYSDVMGSPSFNFAFEILNSFDVYAVDSQYNTSLTTTVNGGSGTTVTIQQGQLTVSLASDSPTGNIAKGQSAVTLGKFKIYAAGEAVKVKFLDFNLSFSTTSAAGTGAAALAAVPTYIKNLALVDDQGSQVGSTINTPGANSNSCDKGTTAATAAAPSVYNDCFGTVGSPINYIIPANATRVLSLKGDVQTGAVFTSVVAALSGQSTANLQGLTSSQTNTSGGVTASSLTLAANALTVAKNASVGTQTVTKSAAGQKIGSYALTASSAEGVNVSNISITAGPNASTNFQNLVLKIGSTQFGTTQTTLANNGIYTFSGTPFTVPAGQTTYVDVYADVLSGAATNEQATTLSSCTGTGAVSFSSVSCASTAGQTVNIGGGPQLTITNANNPVAGQLISGSTQVPLAGFLLTETSGNEDVKITSLNVFQANTTSTTKAAFANLTLYNGNTAVGTAGVASPSANAFPVTSTINRAYGNVYAFNNLSLTIPKSNSVSLMLKGDVPVWNVGSGNLSDGATSTFMIATTTDATNNTTALAVVAKGASSQTTATTTLTSAQGNSMTLLRSNLAVTATLNAPNPPQSRTNQYTDVGQIVLTPAQVGGVYQAVSLNSVKFTVSGSLASTTSFLSSNNATDTLLLVDGQALNGTTNDTLASVTSTVCTGSGCTFTFTFGTGANGFVLNQPKTLTLRLNENTPPLAAATANISEAVSVSIANPTDVAYTTATDGNGVTANLPVSNPTIPITSITFPVGG